MCSRQRIVLLFDHKKGIISFHLHLQRSKLVCSFYRRARLEQWPTNNYFNWTVWPTARKQSETDPKRMNVLLLIFKVCNLLIYSCIMPAHTCKPNETVKRQWKNATQLHIRKSFIFYNDRRLLRLISGHTRKSFWHGVAHTNAVFYKISDFFFSCRAFMVHLAELVCRPLVPKCVCWSDCNNKFHVVSASTVPSYVQREPNAEHQL